MNSRLMDDAQWAVAGEDLVRRCKAKMTAYLEAATLCGHECPDIFDWTDEGAALGTMLPMPFRGQLAAWFDAQWDFAKLAHRDDCASCYVAAKDDYDFDHCKDDDK